MRKKILLAVLLTAWINIQLSAQTLHGIIVANTNDISIGKGCVIDKKIKITEINTIAQTIGYEVNITVISENDFCLEKVDNVVSKLVCHSEDIIYFYYTGHGFNKGSYKSIWPVMALKTGGYQLNAIHEILKNKGARLCITMGDCCNNILGAPDAIDKNLVVVEENTINQEKIYNNLFLKPAGNILISSSEKGETSYCNSENGSFFTNEFNKALTYAANYSNTLSWENLLEDTKNRVLRQNSEKPQTAQYQINLDAKPPQPVVPVVPEVPEYTDINKYLNDIADSNIAESKRKVLLNNYKTYFTENARVDIYVGKTLTDIQTIENFLDRLYLHAEKINTVNLIENKSEITNYGKKYQQITVQEIWENE